MRVEIENEDDEKLTVDEFAGCGGVESSGREVSVQQVDGMDGEQFRADKEDHAGHIGNLSQIDISQVSKTELLLNFIVLVGWAALLEVVIVNCHPSLLLTLAIDLVFGNLPNNEENEQKDDSGGDETEQDVVYCVEDGSI